MLGPKEAHFLSNFTNILIIRYLCYITYKTYFPKPSFLPFYLFKKAIFANHLGTLTV